MEFILYFTLFNLALTLTPQPDSPKDLVKRLNNALAQRSVEEIVTCFATLEDKASASYLLSKLPKEFEVSVSVRSVVYSGKNYCLLTLTVEGRACGNSAICRKIEVETHAVRGEKGKWSFKDPNLINSVWHLFQEVYPRYGKDSSMTHLLIILIVLLPVLLGLTVRYVQLVAAHARGLHVHWSVFAFAFFSPYFWLPVKHHGKGKQDEKHLEENRREQG